MTIITVCCYYYLFTLGRYDSMEFKKSEEYTKAGMIISPCSQWQSDYRAARRRRVETLHQRRATLKQETGLSSLPETSAILLPSGYINSNNNNNNNNEEEEEEEEVNDFGYCLSRLLTEITPVRPGFPMSPKHNQSQWLLKRVYDRPDAFLVAQQTLSPVLCEMVSRTIAITK